MADLFTLLASQVLGSQPEVGPLLPPRFAAWPDLPLASPLIQPPEPVDEPASADMPLFPPPLIGPEHPASDTPLPTFRQLSQVGSGPGPFIQPDVPSMAEDTLETADAEPGDSQPDAAPPVVPAADGSLPDPTTATPPPDVGQTREPLPTPPAQPVVQEEYSDAADAEPGEPGHILDRPVTPLVPDPALKPPAAPEPAPVLQRQGTPEAKIPVPPSPASTTPQTQPVAGQDRPTMNTPGAPCRRADTAKGDQSPSISPLQQASPYQPGDSSPGQASQPADAPVTPLVPEPAQEPPAPAGPPAALAFSPGHDRPTIDRRADTAKGDQSPSISPLQRASPYQPGDSSPGQARPTENPPLSAEGRPAAARDPAAGQGMPAPAQAASVDQRPPGRTQHKTPDDGLGLPGPAEPSIVPVPEPPPAQGRSPSRAGERAFSRRMPARPETGEPEPLPTVRVTIGRIEVRTAPPPPAPVLPRPKPVRQTLSLDEYLKAGTGGQP